MIWGRIATADGRILAGEIRESTLIPHPSVGRAPLPVPPEPMAGATLLAPTVPGKFIGLWNNYQASAEKNGWARPEHPLYFLKPGSSVVGQGAQVSVPRQAGRVIFEGELGVVIGQTCRNASPEAAEAAIFGYTCINDLTSLDVLNADPAFAQWTRAKGFDGFGVIGPVVATQVNWRDLTIRTLVNGRERQSYPASDMIFSPAQVVSHLSHDMTLEPGDVIALGTSLGVRPVKPGDVVAVSIDGIGSVEITLVAPPQAEGADIGS
ncbi:fumarylacetoacetate hydrolase family protein [Pseudotabrizicola sp. L79]|uniref:fumarylacetoacetate hydrolase family protein n=1 Tax=Pseudotabrizicola sp. L79 TaxID=3118402 RepID=UPI002F93050E